MRKPEDSTSNCLKRVAKFEVHCQQFLDADGSPVGPLPEFANRPDAMREFYRLMILTRAFDERAIALQRTGRLGTFASSLGQEAVGIGVASAMSPDDVLLPSFREHGAKLQRGVTLKELFSFWGGYELGNAYSNQPHDFPDCIPVASHFPHAAGVALALKLRSSGSVAVAIAGDGATSKGDFYEAMNITGVWQLPVLFVINNNAWAISVPLRRQTKAKTLAQKGLAAGIPAEQVDGNDIVTVHAAAKEAIDGIRTGSGPRLIEALTYRLNDHTTADDARRYRDDKDVSPHWHDEPVARLRAYMTAKGWWTKDDEQTVLEHCRKEVNAAAEDYLSIKPEPGTAAIDFLFESVPEPLTRQRAALERAVLAKQEARGNG